MRVGYPAEEGTADYRCPASERIAADLLAQAVILSRQRRRAWAALLILAVDMIATERRSAVLAIEMAELAGVAELQGRDALAWKLRQAVSLVDQGLVGYSD